MVRSGHGDNRVPRQHLTRRRLHCSRGRRVKYRPLRLPRIPVAGPMVIAVLVAINLTISAVGLTLG
ncbi:hypothetical protein CGZ92_06120 [Parenemella sanctibonifatiensis]|uniref:Uncharacterized protein n=1 Tax=Parenemella sanctibonifatiensis TaxID=2016505 RepID=A0A255E8D2_9ACTN|nr:hypothetical protein CGZ92_06120 [Parenemella sanctibonifatiensis]